ncbi:MAG TPA: TlpA disulfide reductase family protein [Planosporangium sp.]|jgi:thiol-disulfide isomerase/thioredoxin|nr:TlpA disulfide reductase family protein [Planosporangium sp.]
MRRPVWIVSVLTALAVLAGCSSGPSSSGPSAPDTGTGAFFEAGRRQPTPKLTGELLDGGGFDLAQHRGEVVVVNLWASWCSPCRAEAPELVAVADATKAQRVSFVGIDIRDDRDKAKAFVQRHAITYPSLFDPAGRSVLDFAKVPPSATPSTLIIDRQGRIAALYTKPLMREELESAVRRVAAEPD